MPQQFVTLVSAGGVPVRLANQNGTPFPTTGSGSLVFATNPVLVNPTLQGVTYEGGTGFGAGTLGQPAIYFGTSDRGFYSTGVGNLSAVANGILLWAVDSPGDFTPGRNLVLVGSSSGSTTLKAAAAASGIVTLPAATDTLVGKATTDTFTNKTFDTAATGNSLLINGVAATANTGTGAMVRASSPTLITPNLGTPSAVDLTNATGLPLATGVSGILVGANGGTGVANTGKTITLGGNLVTSGAFAVTLTLTNTTNVTLPTSGTLATTGANSFGGAQTITVDDGIILTNQTDGAAAQTGTLTNAPAAGNPHFWIPVSVNGTAGWVPWWHA